MSDEEVPTGRHARPKPMPEWLLGLGIAIVIVLLGWLVLTLLGAGDDPTFVEGLAV
ncbi:MAG TPA: hypothetical protein VLB67_07715 [Acidimicrobiia bacterium]|nr:hypothetical protein [Acidimicrobiia bacterium]